MGVISFRLSDDDERRLRQAGINPGPAAKEKMEAEARRLRARELRGALESFSRPPSKPVTELVREIREEH